MVRWLQTRPQSRTLSFLATAFHGARSRAPLARASRPPPSTLWQTRSRRSDAREGCTDVGAGHARLGAVRSAQGSKAKAPSWRPQAGCGRVGREEISVACACAREGGAVECAAVAPMRACIPDKLGPSKQRVGDLAVSVSSVCRQRHLAACPQREPCALSPANLSPTPASPPQPRSRLQQRRTCALVL